MVAPRHRPTSPATQRNRALLVLVLAAAVMLAATKLPERGPWALILGTSGATVALFALVSALIAQVNAGRYARLLRGEGVIGRWTVTPEQWRRFVEESYRLDQKSSDGVNQLDLRMEPPASGVEVIVADNALSVAGQFKAVEKNATITVHSSFMEFRQVISGGDGSDVCILLRIPVAPGAQGDAERVRRHYQQSYAAAASSPRTKLYVALGFGLFILVFVVWGLLSGIGQ